MGCGRRAGGDAGPYGGLHEVRWAGDRTGRPYEGLQEVRGRAAALHQGSFLQRSSV